MFYASTKNYRGPQTLGAIYRHNTETPKHVHDCVQIYLIVEGLVCGKALDYARRKSVYVRICIAHTLAQRVVYLLNRVLMQLGRKVIRRVRKCGLKDVPHNAF